MSHEWLIRFLEHRIGDVRILRLIQKWLKAGVLENGVVTDSEKRTGQGTVSPLLAMSIFTTASISGLSIGDAARPRAT